MCAVSVPPCADSVISQPLRRRLLQSRNTAAQSRDICRPSVTGMTDDRRRQLGATGEQIAADHLIRRGFQILERNFRTRFGELDLIATDGRVTAFVEVKTRVARNTRRDPLESVHPHKRTQVRMMARQWLGERPDRPRTPDLRFDAIGITIDPGGRLLRLDHLEGAF